MKRWLRRWMGRTRLDDSLSERLKSLPAPGRIDDRRLQDTRWVVVDLETTGLNLNKDQVISIGAVVIEHSRILLGDAFEATLMRADSSLGNSVLVHGLTPAQLAQGEDPARALLDFLEFVADSPLLAFHAPFDQRMLEKALRQDLQLNTKLPFWDVAELAQWLLPEKNLPRAGLDDWLQAFGLQVSQRHNAGADALATAELTLILLRLLQQRGIHDLLAMDNALRTARQLNPHRI